ncbi:SPOR domain-containing protein [Salipiger mangrovisoli]|uniref:SPOR domain-containing protein n=1 Tax=Salipiger mangrovisoli TaxID=2865933 RepID=A0ABR9X3R4_9RHOB|nr:SPOR domain-containing protein [Salipiger mangrovisoli]MBE9638229.1 SPOR domain-containing protein [Salipiger mangrovisoli]
MRITVLARHAILALGTALGSVLAAAPVLAQRIDTISEPAELPPSSFTGPQYVDSRGCVFIRAGFDDAVIWVPRVSRAGAPVCGYAPSLAGQSRSVEAPAAPAPAPAPTTQTRSARAAPTGAPMATVASKPASAPAPVAVVKAPASKPPAAPAPRVVASVPAAKPAPTRAPSATAVPAPTRGQLVGGACAPGFSGQIVSDGRSVRCGPQTSPYATEVRRGEAPAPGKNVYYNHGGGLGSWQDGKLMVPGSTRILPRHVFEEGPAERTVVPAGYRPAWEDDRLNPNRALQTVKGYYDTQRVWTQEVPRASTAGTVVVAQAPRVRFEGDPALKPAQSTTATTMIAAASDGASDAGSAPRYVQIGVFSTADRAGEATRRLRAAGLPVEELLRKSDGMRRLRVGPYSDARDAGLALAKVRATGYRGAILR